MEWDIRIRRGRSEPLGRLVRMSVGATGVGGGLMRGERELQRVFVGFLRCGWVEREREMEFEGFRETR